MEQGSAGSWNVAVPRLTRKAAIRHRVFNIAQSIATAVEPALSIKSVRLNSRLTPAEPFVLSAVARISEAVTALGPAWRGPTCRSSTHVDVDQRDEAVSRTLYTVNAQIRDVVDPARPHLPR